MLFLDSSKKDQTYISDVFTLLEYILRIKIKNKCENKEDLDLFLNGSNFTWDRTIIPIRLTKVIFLQVTHQRVLAHEV